MVGRGVVAASSSGNMVGARGWARLHAESQFQNANAFEKLSDNFPEAFWKLSRKLPKLSESFSKVVRKLLESCPKASGKLSESFSKVVRKLLESCPKVSDNFREAFRKASIPASSCFLIIRLSNPFFPPPSTNPFHPHKLLNQFLIVPVDIYIVKSHQFLKVAAYIFHIPASTPPTSTPPPHTHTLVVIQDFSIFNEGCFIRLLSEYT
jgi:hypothetical protein